MNCSQKLQVIIFLLVLLFVYTASSKLMDFDLFKAQMVNQTIPQWAAAFLIWTLPGVEFLTSFLLLNSTTRKIGLWMAFILMCLFTLYILLILFHFFGRVPCSCGGVLKAMGWKVHFVFNLFFLLLTAAGLFIDHKERRAR